MALTGDVAEGADCQSSGEDVLSLVALAGQGGTPDTGVAPHDSDSEEVQMLVAAAGAKRKFAHSSWEHVKNARAGKKLKAAERKGETLEQQKTTLSNALVCAAQMVPSIRSVLAAAGCNARGDMVKATAISHLAFAALCRGTQPQRWSQTRAAGVVADCALHHQSEWLRSLSLPQGVDDPASDALGDYAPPNTVNVFTWQWDETSQRIKAIMRAPARGERVGTQQVAQQIMVQAGHCTQFMVGAAGCIAQSSNRLLARPLVLVKQDADHMLEGLSRGMPVFLTRFRTCSSSAQARMLSF